MENKTTEILVNELIQFAKGCDNKVSQELDGAPLQRDLNGLLIVCIYMRLSELFHSIIALANERLPSGGYIVLRTMVECYIHLHGCINDESFADEYVKKHLHTKKKRLKSMGRDLSSLERFVTVDEIAKYEEDLDEALQDYEVPTLADSYQMFKRFGQERLYHMVFTHCSLWTHNDSHTFHHYLSESPTGFQLCQKVDFDRGTAHCLLIGLKIFFFAYEDVSRLAGREPLYRVEFSEAYNSFDAQLLRIFGE